MVAEMFADGTVKRDYFGAPPFDKAGTPPILPWCKLGRYATGCAAKRQCWRSGQMQLVNQDKCGPWCGTCAAPE